MGVIDTVQREGWEEGQGGRERERMHGFVRIERDDAQGKIHITCGRCGMNFTMMFSTEIKSLRLQS